MRRILGNAQLQTHYGRDGILYCMASKSGDYLNPHLTMNLNEVTCQKCLKLLKFHTLPTIEIAYLEQQNKRYADESSQHALAMQQIVDAHEAKLSVGLTEVEKTHVINALREAYGDEWCVCCDSIVAKLGLERGEQPRGSNKDG